MTVLQFAQTNIQLYNQMRDEAYDDAAIGRVVTAYRLATRIFVGKYRGSGKTLIAHLVGTASLLAWLGRPAPVVAAGLLHAAYEDGDFGSSDPVRAMKEAAGPDVEQLVSAYHALKWSYSEELIQELRRREPTMSDQERQATVIRIANEVEDYLDLATMYHGKPDDDESVVKSGPWRLGYMETVEKPLAELAEVFGEPRLAEQIRSQFEATRKKQDLISPSLRSGRPYMYFIPPASYRRTLRGKARVVKQTLRRVREVGATRAVNAVRGRLRAKLSR